MLLESVSAGCCCYCYDDQMWAGVARFMMPRLVSSAAAREPCCRLQSLELSRHTRTVGLDGWVSF